MKSINRQLLLCAFAGLLSLVFQKCNNTHTQTKQDAKATRELSAQDMQKDLEILYTAFKDIHPAYGLFTSATSLDSIYNTTITSLQQPLSEDEFIAAIYPFVSAVKCGHTQVKHSANYDPDSAPAMSYLPFKVLVQNSRVWVTAHQVNGPETGDELLKINNTPVADIVIHGGNLYAADGNNQTFKELFLSEYDGFEDACNKFYHWKSPYIIEYKSKNGVVKTIRTDTLSKADSPAVSEVDNYKNWTTSSNTNYLPLRFLKNEATACFEVHSYQYEDTSIFKKAFKEIREKKIKNLIIDLRHNTGGDIRIAAKLLTYLSNTPFQMVGDLWARVPDPGNTNFRQYFDSVRTLSCLQSFKPTGIKIDGHYQIEFQPEFGNLLAKMNLEPVYHYNGRLVVLTDGATFSSGAHTAAALRQYCPEAVFIGRETAGGAEGCSGGNIQLLTLPGTGIVIEFPMLRVVSVYQHPTFGHGIIPDYTVSYSPEDIVSKRDLDLQKAMEIPGFKSNKL